MREADHQPAFYIKVAGLPVGPFSIEHLAAAIISGEVRARTDVTIDGAEAWFPAAALKLFPRLTRRYHDWLWCLIKFPQSAGSKATALVVGATPLTITAVILGLALFPPGTYPRIVLVAPGLIVGAVFAYLYGFIAFKLPMVLSVALSALAGIGGGYVLIKLLTLLTS